MLHQLIRPAILVFSLSMPLWLFFRLFVTKFGKNASVAREALFFVLYVYITCVLLVTTFPVPMTRHYEGETAINLIPVKRTVREFSNALSRGSNIATDHFLENIIGNILLFVPLGILLPLLFRKMVSFKNLLLTAIGFSFLVEFIQFIERFFGNYRSVDIDDIILNTVGALLGYAMIRSVGGWKKMAR